MVLLRTRSSDTDSPAFSLSTGRFTACGIQHLREAPPKPLPTDGREEPSDVE
jgi:hypothetical protein